MEVEGEMAMEGGTGEEVKGGEYRRVILISAGASHSVALLYGNVVCSWGRGEDGQLGHGDPEDRISPTHLSALDGLGVTSVTCGADHTTAYSESCVQLYSWGWGDFGRLGHGNSSDFFTPQPIKALDGVRIKQIACGDSHCLAVTLLGEVASWGRNQNGQLGLGTVEDSLVPQKLQAFQGIPVKMVAAGAEHSTAITEDGEIYGWGWGRYGNLGLGDREDRLVPQRVSSVKGEKMILVACGWRHTISVSTSGGLYTFGWSKYGQLGHGNFEDHLTPHKLEALRDHFISQISGGWRHSMAVTSDGKLYGWGWNKYLVVLGGFFAISSDTAWRWCLVSLLADTGGNSWWRWCWFGQVGVGDNVDHCSPVQVLFPHDQKVVQICCGWRHTLAVTDRQNVFSWGRGTNGQLGHGDSFDRNLPTIIEAMSFDGSSGRQIESSSVNLLSGKFWIPSSGRFAVVPDETMQGQVAVSQGNGSDASVPENDMRIG
ncbi:hypothetical protein Nepgr_013228 [Nepenthes gracilis]|uniref:Ultraviolet-B receptor UVR8 n=1 Tax=Nepenthes gracilis TaxID=150966 RepID=A0AAD3SIS7_NEPGR|nr:hypothetical protein Nepgr_013228 [Nepenthes gracilis]